MLGGARRCAPYPFTSKPAQSVGRIENESPDCWTFRNTRA